MITIKNAVVCATINPKGAELVSLVHKSAQIEYMWSADPAFWGKSSPVLFPVVGALKNNVFIYEENKYTLPRHGFARDQLFIVESQTEDSVVFLLKYNDASLAVFPFRFEFRICYSLDENKLNVTYEVINMGDTPMWFSVGGHPAFRVPLAEGTSYEDYYLEFDTSKDLMQWPLADEGLIASMPEKLELINSRLPLTKSLFYQDALVFKHLDTSVVSLKSDKTSCYLKFWFEGFPFLGIWAAKDADFVCIEPWCGIADGVNHTQQLTEKEGINVLNSGERFDRTWIAELGV